MKLWQEEPTEQEESTPPADPTTREERKRKIAEAEALLEAAECANCSYRDREVILHQIWLLLNGTPPLEMLRHRAVFDRFHQLTRQIIRERDDQLREARSKGW